MKGVKTKQIVPQGVLNTMIETLSQVEKNAKKTNNKEESKSEPNDDLSKFSPKSRRKELIRRSREVGKQSSQRKILSRIDPKKMDEIKNLQSEDYQDPETINKLLGYLNHPTLNKCGLKKDINSLVNDPVSRELAMSMVGMSNDDLLKTAHSINQHPELRDKIAENLLPKLDININSTTPIQLKNSNNNNDISDDVSDDEDEEIEYIVGPSQK